jgi:hypothetical protein
VTGGGVPDGDMPISLRPERGDVPQLGDPAFDALLARALRPEEAVASLRPVVEGFAALYAAPVYSGPAAEASALTAFRGLAGQDGGRTSVAGTGLGRAGGRPAGGRRAGGHRAGGHRPRQHRTGWWVRSRLAGVRLAVAAAAVALTAGSAVAAYAGDLPAPMQRLAHTVMGAPPAAGGTPRPDPGSPAAPPVPGNAAYGLCRAYERAVAHGHPGHNPVTSGRLARAAGGAGRVAAYCAQLVHPGNPAHSHPAPPQHGKPSALPTHHAKPTPAATHHGRPSTLPTPATTNHGNHTS